MGRTREVLGKGWRLMVLGGLVGCGTPPVATQGPAREAPATEPAPLPAPAPTSEDPAPPPAAPPESPAPEFTPGRLCGPASRPCTVELDETIADSTSKDWERGATTLLLDGQQRPHLFAAGTAFGGALTVRSHEGTWSVQKLPSDWAQAAFTLRGDEPLFTRGDREGKAPLTIWKQVEGTWRLEADLGLPLPPWEGVSALQTDSQGQLHALLRTTRARIGLVQVAEAEGWTPHIVDSDPDGDVMIHAGFVLPPRAETQLAYWKRASASNLWTLFWQTGTTRPEQVVSLSPSRFGITPGELALGWTRDEGPGGQETRHLFFTRPQEGAMDVSEIAYAARRGEGAWTVRPLLPTVLLTPRCRTTPPRTQADSCVEEFIFHAPGAVVTSGAELRFFARWMHFRHEWDAYCPGFDHGGGCGWREGTRSYTQGTKMFWSGGEQSGTVDLPQLPADVEVVAAQADSEGRLHLMLRDNEYPMHWRYLRLGAGPARK